MDAIQRARMRKLIAARLVQKTARQMQTTKAINWQREDIPRDWDEAFDADPEGIIDPQVWASRADDVIDALNEMSDTLDKSFKKFRDALKVYATDVGDSSVMDMLNRYVPASSNILPQVFNDIVNTINDETNG